MNVVSEIDAARADTVSKPDIILGEDWEERARAETRPGAGPPADGASESGRRRFIVLNRSPLARKIITFNLLALVVLVGGVLYLNQFRDGLVEQRERALITEAQLIADVFEARLPDVGPVNLAAGDGVVPAEVLDGLSDARTVEIFVFDAAGNLVARRSPDPADLAAGDSSPPYGTIVTDFLNAIWERLSRLSGSPPRQAADAAALARRAAPLGLQGETRSESVVDANGDILFSVTTPIRRGDEVIGAIVLTTVAGEINRMAREEREQILQMFLVAILVSIGLSLVLASTIANPLRDLAAAARAGRRRDARKLSPEKVRIPDMTGRPDEIGELSGELRKMVDALYQRIDSNEQFARDVAHEVKNPLSSLRSAVDTLRVAGDDPERREKLLAVIEHDVRRLDRLISDISNASRLDSDLMREEVRPFNLVETLEKLSFHLKQQAEEKGVEFIIDLPSEPIVIHGIEERIAQVVVNLLSNAISFCEDGDAVRIWCRQRENRVLIVVEDTGPGIPEEALTKVFNRFYSERPGQKFGDHSGLGLAISKQIVEAHGGVIWAENIRPTEADPTSEPLGARFVVGLPV